MDSHASFPPTPQSSPPAAKNEHWERVKTLFEQAHVLQGSEQDEFLQRECQGNAHLHSELKSLLATVTEEHDFLEEPAIHLSDFLQEEEEATSSSNLYPSGTRIGAYSLERRIGCGGMGDVYLASRADREFDQVVAIKLIRSDAESALAIQRFRRERQILAGLEHAYIARLLDGGTTAEGVPYFIMEYVQGQPVTHYCEAQSLTVRDCLHLFLKICSAVQYAHERNIIHRDLKPGNILVREDGTPKLLDFGIAKSFHAESRSDPHATQQGSRLLTPAYASPEQLRGSAATIGSDIYSLGVILHQLICGSRPDEVLPQAHETSLSPALRSMIRRAIAEHAHERYPSVQSFAADLRSYLSGSTAHPSTYAEQDGVQAKTSLAILPFRVFGAHSSQNAYLTTGIAETLIGKLSRIERLAVAPPSAVLRYAEGAEASRVARELRVAYILEGSLHMSADNVRANVQLVFAEAGMAVWAGRIEATESALLTMEDSIAEQVAQAVLPHLSGEERAAIVPSGTTSSEAHSAYLKGRWHFLHSSGEPETLAQALLCFTKAVHLDPNFARAHAGIADYYLRLGLWGGLPPAESFAAAIQAAETALRLDPGLGEAHASLGFGLWAYHGDEAAAERALSLAILRNPTYASAHHWLGLLNSASDRSPLAIANLERARSLDPNSSIIAAALAFVHYNARRYEQAMQLLLAAARELPQFGLIQEMMAWCCLQSHDAKGALEHASEGVRLGDRSSSSLSALAHAYAANGHRSLVAEVRAEVEHRVKERYVSGYDRASLAMADGDPQSAVRLLAEAREQRDWWTCWIHVDPRWDVLRAHPQFAKRLSRRSLPFPPKRHSRTLLFVPAVAVLVIAFVILGIRWFRSAPILPFANVHFTKLTTNGTAEHAVLSPDGKTLVYADHSAGQTTIWRRELATGRSSLLVPVVKGKLDSLDFTNGGSTVQFVSFPSNSPGVRSVSLVPVNGGDVKQLDKKFPGPVTLNMSGDQLAGFQSNLDAGADELFRFQMSSASRHVLRSFPYPTRPAWNCPPSWSSDGKHIAYAFEDHDAKGFLLRLGISDVSNGAQQRVASPRWQWIQGIRWVPGDQALVVVGQEHESSFQQIWYLPLQGSNGHARRIGSDLDDYFDASVATVGSTIVSVQQQLLSNVYLGKAEHRNRLRQITPGTGRYFDLSAMPDGHILYASDASGSADLWMMNSDGSGQRTIASGAGRKYAPAASPDSQSIVFHSNRTGNWQVWKTSVDNDSAIQLSSSSGDGNWPQFTPDGRFVVFHRTAANGVVNLWRVPAQGGQGQLLTSALTMHPAVARDGRIAAWYSDKADRTDWKLAIFGPDGGRPSQVLDPTPHARPDTPIRWTPDGKALSILDFADSVANIWIVPLSGQQPHPVTSFESGEIFSFDWSQRGDLLCSHGVISSDVVLIHDRDTEKEAL